MKQRFIPLLFFFILFLSWNKDYGQVTIWTDPMDPQSTYTYSQSFTGSIPGDWVCSGTAGQFWTYNGGQGYCANGSAKCTPNANYNNNVDVFMKKTGITSPAVCSFKFKGNIEDSFDYIYLQTSPDGIIWTTQDNITGNYTGWFYTEVYLPAGTTQVRFEFISDGTVTKSGMYIDDIFIYSIPCTPTNWTASGPASAIDNWSPSAYCGTNARYTSANYSMRCSAWENDYNDDIENYLTTSRNLPLTALLYTSGSLSFRVWNQTESNYDYIYCEYNDGGWTTAWSQSGDYSGTGWQTISGINIPVTATQIRFRFKSDFSNTYEGVYIDDVILTAIPNCTYPTQATNMTFSGINCTQMQVNWSRGTGNNIIVLARAGSAVNADPIDGFTYNANAAFMSGDQIGVGNYVVYKGALTNVIVTALSNSTTYYYAAYEYNTATGFCYKKPALTSSSPTLYPPSVTVQPTTPQTISAISGSTNFSITTSGAVTAYQWYYSVTGVGTAPGAGWSVCANGTPAGSVYAGSTTATLSVSSITPVGTYYYQCVVTGTCAPVANSNTATLNVICNSAAVPGGLLSANVGATNVDMSWNVVAGDPTITYWWEIHRTTGDVFIVSGTTTSLSASYNLLACNTQYHFHVKAMSSCNGIYSALSVASGNFTTIACGPRAHRSNTNPTAWNTNANWQMSPINCNTGGVWAGNTQNVAAATSCNALIRNGFPVNLATADVPTPPNITVDPGAVLNISGGRTLTIPANTTLINNGTINLAVGASAGTLVINGGTLINNGIINVGTITGIGTITFTNGTFTNNSTGTITIAATVANVITIAATKTLTNYGIINNSRTITVNGTLSNYGNISNVAIASTISVNVAAVITNQIAGTITNDGTINLVNGNNPGGIINNYGIFINNYQVTIYGDNNAIRIAVFNNYGTYTEQSNTTGKYTFVGYTGNNPGRFNNLAGATFTVSSANGFGMLVIGDAANNKNGTFVNSGTLNINDAYAFSGGAPFGLCGNRGTLTNNLGGIINIASTSQNNFIGLDASVTFTNSGTINNNGILDYYWGTWTNNVDGIINNNNLLIDDAIITNNGNYNEYGSTFVGYFYIGTSVFNNNLNYTIYPLGIDNSSGISIGYDATYMGTFNNAGTLTNNSNSDSYVGINISDGSTLNNSGTLNNNGDVIQTDLFGGATISNTGTWNENSWTNIVYGSSGTSLLRITNGSFNIGTTGKLSLGEVLTTVTAPGIIDNYGEIDFYGSYISGTGSLTTRSNSTLSLYSVSGSTDFINSGIGSGNIRISGTRTLNAATNYYLSSNAAGMTMGNGYPTNMQDLKITVPQGLSVTPASLTVSRDLIIYAGNVNTNNKTINIDRDFSNGGVLTLGTGSLIYTGSGRFMSNLTNLLEDFESVSTDAYLWYGGWGCVDATWYCRTTIPRSLRKSARLEPSLTAQRAISPSVDLTAGRSYTFSFWYNKSGTGNPTNLIVEYSTDYTFAVGVTTIINVATVSNVIYTQASFTFSPGSSGRYYFSIKGTTPVTTYLYFDDVYITTSPASQPLKKFNMNSGGTVLLATPAYVDPANGDLTLTKGAFSTGNNLTINDLSTIVCYGGILADPPTILNTSSINVTYNTPAPPALITTRAELPTSNSTGYLNNLTTNNSSGVTLNKIPLSPAVLSSQDFNSLVTPVGWGEENVTGTPTISYQAICTFFSGSVTPAANSFGASMVLFNADGCNSGDQKRLKQTTSFATTGYSNIRVNFDWYYQTDYENYVEGLTLQWSTDGSTWTPNIPLTNFYGAGTTGWQTKTVLLPAGAENLPNLYIAFLFTSESKSKCIIDNFTVTGMQYTGSILDVTVNGNLTGGILTLTQGALSLNSNKLIINNALNTAINRAAGYIVSETDAADNTSKVQWNIGANITNHVFPFGTNGGSYIPVEFQGSGTGPGNITIATRPTVADDNGPFADVSNVAICNDMTGTGTNVTSAIDRWWDITSSLNPSPGTTLIPPVTLKLTYLGSENTTISPTDNIGFQHWDGVTWNDGKGGGWGTVTTTGTAGFGPISPGPHTVTATGLRQFSPYILAKEIMPLPVNLITFNSNCDNAYINCKWSTASETNNDYFILQKSFDAENWDFVAQIKGAGNSNEIKNYEYFDKKSINGLIYYQLIQRDYNGKETVYNTSAVSCETKDDFLNIVVFPNPANSEINIILNSAIPDEGKVYIYNDIGMCIYQSDISIENETSRIKIDLAKLSIGSYYLKCVFDKHNPSEYKFVHLE